MGFHATLPNIAARVFIGQIAASIMNLVELIRQIDELFDQFA